MREQMSAPLNATAGQEGEKKFAREQLDFDLTRLRLRIENLEMIVRELLRDRVPEDMVNAWLEVPGQDPFGNLGLRGRGKDIANLMDVIEELPPWPPKRSPKG